MINKFGMRNPLQYGAAKRPSAIQFLQAAGQPATGGAVDPLRLMQLRKSVIEQQIRPQRTAAEQMMAMSTRMKQTPAVKPPSLGDRISGMMPAAGTPQSAGLGAAGAKMLQLSGYSDRPIAMGQILGEAAQAYTTARKETAAEQRKTAAEQAAAERQARLDAQATEMHKAKLAEMGVKKAPKLETLYDSETGLEYKAFYNPDSPDADEFGYVRAGGTKAAKPVKRDIKTVAGVGLVDVTDPDSPKIIMEAGKTEKRDLRTVAGVGVVDFSDPDNPKVLYESQPSETRRYQNIGAYMLNGKYLGEGTFDTKTNKRFIKNEEGEEVPIPSEAIPVTESLFGKGILGAQQMQATDAELVDLRNGLKRYTSYLENVKDTETGYKRLGDQLSTYVKNFMSTNSKRFDLSESEFALAVAQGQFQGLLGGARIDTVGGGVMTEQDALRVIENLGGNLTSLQNPEVVADQIGRMFANKYNAYEQKRATFNRQVDSFYKGMGYESLGELDFNKDVIPSKYLKEMGFEVPETRSGVPEGVSPDVWAEMTDTEKALWNE